jgi:hypothetical protein
MSLPCASLIAPLTHWPGILVTPAIVRHPQHLRTETAASAAKEVVA